MVSPAVMGTGTVSNVSAKSVSRNSCSGSGSDFKKVMAGQPHLHRIRQEQVRILLIISFQCQ